MKNSLTLGFLICTLTSLFASAPIYISETINWEKNVRTYNINEQKSIFIHRFENASYNDKSPTLPIFTKRFPVTASGELKTTFVEAEYLPLEDTRGIDETQLSEEIIVRANVSLDRKTPFGFISFIPIRKNLATGTFEKLISFKLKILLIPNSRQNTTNRLTTSTSVLSIGDIYKIPVAQNGIHKLDFDYLKNTLGIPVENINPRHIKLFGNGGGMLPEDNAISRYDDLVENAIYISGENDGSFDNGDFILFYGEGPNQWKYDENQNRFVMEQHLYDDNNYYFLRINDGNPSSKRINSNASISSTAYSTNQFDDFRHWEEEEINILAENTGTSGSGKEWFGPSFKFTTERSYNFSFPNLVTSTPIDLTCQVIARSVGGGTHQFNVFANGNQLYAESMGSVSGSIYLRYANLRSRTVDFSSTSDNIVVKLEYQKPNSTAEGWLDYITLNARRQLRFEGEQLAFRDKNALAQASATYTLSNAPEGIAIWDISNPLEPKIQAFNYNAASSQASFGAVISGLPEYIAFEMSDVLVPEAGIAIANQNLHALEVSDMLVIYHSSLESSVQRFVEHRESHSGIEVTAVEINAIYNEFSSGMQDVTAIRDFAKYFYDQASPVNGLKYLLLFGDASFDYKNHYEITDNYNLVPTFQTYTISAIDALDSHPSDDFFGLLDDNEGGNINSGSVDLAIGRFPVRNLTEANAIVNKIIHYETSPECLGDWRNRLLFNADDEDDNTHIDDADSISRTLSIAHPVFNIDKLYWDAFNQVSTPGGNRYPDVTEALNTNIGFKGQLVVNYMGHGGPTGWSQERVFTIDQALTWNNYNTLPLFVTATCTFGPFEDPTAPSAAELLLTKNDGGAIGLFTTVRAVYASTNETITRAVFNKMFEPVNGKIPSIGEILRLSKNMIPTGPDLRNGRKFTLLGDPSLYLPNPQYNIKTSTINGNSITGTDTIQALQEVTIKGYIEAAGGGILTDFNGIITPTVYDKSQDVKTLVNDSGSLDKSFNLQKNIIFKGRTSVTNGEFSFTFVVPSDINYQYGFGKISYYADDGSSRDARGYYSGIVIGGTAENGVTDNDPPKVKVYLNDENFAFGGTTDENPVLFAKITDDVGINTVGTGIGHDLTGVLDAKTSDTYVLNDYYESELDNPKAGEVRYPLSGLAEGLHTIKVKAWDVSNNSGEDYTEFIVASSAQLSISQVLNFPNPFTTSTSFQFNHNFPSQALSVQVQIFTVGGRLLKTIDSEIMTNGYRVTDIEWDGRDDFGDRIGKGVYIYKVKVGAINANGDVITSNSAFEKLVILK